MKNKFLVQAEKDVLAIIATDKDKEWTTQEIIAQIDRRHGQKLTRDALHKLAVEDKIVLRRCASNLFTYHLVFNKTSQT